MKIVNSKESGLDSQSFKESYYVTEVEFGRREKWIREPHFILPYRDEDIFLLE